ncbi:MAG: DUF1641 domain-containing protein [Deltaproteobacteria bacterium]|nr:MAG: DUF1641 domain-containing protein [Deltaproteobacteria bacterium]
MTNEELLLERLARIEERLEGVARVEKQLEVFAGPWETLSDLGKEFSILLPPATRQLSEELAEVEIGFQVEDLFTLLKKFLPALKYLTWSLEQLENLIDWWSDLEPVLKIAVPKMIDQLDVLEQHRVFTMFGRIFSVEMLSFMERLSEVALTARLEEAKPVGPIGILWQLKSPECRQGLGVLVELTRALSKMQPPAAAAT